MQFKQIPRKTAPLYIIENTFKGIKYGKILPCHCQNYNYLIMQKFEVQHFFNGCHMLWIIFSFK